MNELQRLQDAVLLAASVCLVAAMLHTQSLPREPVHLDFSLARIKAGLLWQLDEMGKLADRNWQLSQFMD